MSQGKTANQIISQHQVKHSDETVLLSSRKSAWQGIALEHLRLPSGDLSDVTALNHYLTMPFGSSKTIELKANGKFRQQQLIPGNVCITPAQHLHGIRWNNGLEILMMTLEPAFVTKALQGSVNADQIELVLHVSQNDPLIREILLALKVELEAGCPSGSLYGEAMGTALAAHLFKTYTTRKLAPSKLEDGLPQHKLTPVLEYIQAHLDQEIRLIDLAELTGMSQYYFCRLFKRSLGVPPHQYVLQQRIERSKRLLKQRDLAISEVALMCGFKNQSHLTTLFRKSTGTTPKTFRMLA
jgi:AraC family transcriptional regulator